MSNLPFTPFEQTRRALEECAQRAHNRATTAGNIVECSNAQEERNAFRVIATYLTEEGAADLRRLLCK